MFPCRMICCFFICLVLSPSILCGADTAAAKEKSNASWYLAATAFSVDKLPSEKKASGVLIPQLLLEKIYGASYHCTLPEETVFSGNQEQRDKRIKAINSLQSLYTERDKLFFAVTDSIQTKSKYRDVTKKIEEAEKTLSEVVETTSNAPEKTEQLAAGTHIPISLWSGAEKSTNAFTPADVVLKKTLAPQLQKLKISGLITGSIESIGAYVSITCRLYVYPMEDPVCEISDAGSWELLDQLLSLIADRLLPHIYGQIPAEIMIDVTPKSAAAVMDQAPMPLMTVQQVFPGTHTFIFKADGFYPHTKEYTFEPAKKYKISVDLEEIQLRVISYGKADEKQLVVFEGFNQPLFGDKFSLPFSETIGYTEMPDGSNAWFIIPEVTFANVADMQYSAPLNPADMNDIINRRRNIMYTSLGALYLFLPVSMYFNGTYDNMMSAYNAGAYTDIDELNRTALLSNVTTCIGIGLGVNFAVHLVRYLIAVNRLTPQVLEPVDIFTSVQELESETAQPESEPEMSVENQLDSTDTTREIVTEGSKQ